MPPIDVYQLSENLTSTNSIERSFLLWSLNQPPVTSARNAELCKGVVLGNMDVQDTDDE